MKCPLRTWKSRTIPVPWELQCEINTRQSKTEIRSVMAKKKRFLEGLNASLVEDSHRAIPGRHCVTLKRLGRTESKENSHPQKVMQAQALSREGGTHSGYLKGEEKGHINAQGYPPALPSSPDHTPAQPWSGLKGCLLPQLNHELLEAKEVSAPSSAPGSQRHLVN